VIFYPVLLREQDTHSEASLKMGSFGSFWVFEGNSFTKPFAVGGQEPFSMGDFCLAAPGFAGKEV
jgi:hypothetical protein